MNRALSKWKMKSRRIYAGILLIVITLSLGFGEQQLLSSSAETNAAATQSDRKELRGVWISYLELNDIPTDQSGFQLTINQMFDHVKEMGMNAVFVHVRPDSDAMYPSSYFPWSKFASGTQGVDPGYDPLAYMIEAAHQRNLEFHAWINPYRVTGYLMGYDGLSADNPARIWLTDQDSTNDRWVLLHDGAYYYNPAIPQVRELITNGVNEIVSNYAVDGIHFDDYFYPNLKNDQPLLWFDLPEYQTSGSAQPITQWRREQVNSLVSDVYRTVKAIKPEVVFGISPAGYVANLRSDSMLFVDIDTWMSQTGYIDYIMPQLYWGFEAKTKNQQPAPYAYPANLQIWTDLADQGNVTLYLGLAMSRAGTNVTDHNAVSEWLSHQDIIKRQVEAARATGKVDGYCFFSYRSFYTEAARQEAENLYRILN